MGVILFTVGGGLVVIALYDFLRSTISLSGLGPISAPIAFLLWSWARVIAAWSERHTGYDVRGLIGPSILATIAAAWIALPLTGYTLMYASGASLIVSETDAPASFLDRVAFSGSALSTLGASIVSPTSGWWDLLSMIAAINGMIVLTLSVSFILTILQTTLSARGLAVRCSALMSDPDIDDPVGDLHRLAPLGSDLCATVVQLSASPLPGMFVPSDPRMNFPAAVGRMCDLVKRADGLPGGHATAKRECRELEEALRLLGRQAPGVKSSDDIAAARAWSTRFNLPRRSRPD